MRRSSLIGLMHTGYDWHWKQFIDECVWSSQRCFWDVAAASLEGKDQNITERPFNFFSLRMTLDHQLMGCNAVCLAQRQQVSQLIIYDACRMIYLVINFVCSLPATGNASSEDRVPTQPHTSDALNLWLMFKVLGSVYFVTSLSPLEGVWLRSQCNKAWVITPL